VRRKLWLVIFNCSIILSVTAGDLLEVLQMLKQVYIETTIPSFYYEIRKEPEMVARRNWTREWWNKHAIHYELVTSEPVLEELRGGDYPNKRFVLSLIKDIPLVAVESEIVNIVESYIKHKAMPAYPIGDALHLANANKFFHIRRVNTLLALFTPNIVTPLELLGG
jgi:hypothetical protein